jgi:hypothetical protein
MIEELAGRVFAARNIAHLQHFTTRSYAQHQALGEFYEQVIDALDELVECYQGQFDVIGDVEIPMPEVKKIADYLREEADWIESNRMEIAADSESVASLVDVLVNVYTRTIFKLTRLQ